MIPVQGSLHFSLPALRLGDCSRREGRSSRNKTPSSRPGRGLGARPCPAAWPQRVEGACFLHVPSGRVLIFRPCAWSFGLRAAGFPVQLSLNFLFTAQESEHVSFLALLAVRRQERIFFLSLHTREVPRNFEGGFCGYLVNCELEHILDVPCYSCASFYSLLPNQFRQ